jgi:hypothetical protein
MKSDMKSHARQVVANDALFRVSIRQAEEAGLNEIRISVARAKEILRDLTILKRDCEAPVVPVRPHRLDSIINIETFRTEQEKVMNQAIKRILA